MTAGCTGYPNRMASKLDGFSDCQYIYSDRILDILTDGGRLTGSFRCFDNVSVETDVQQSEVAKVGVGKIRRDRPKRR